VKAPIRATAKTPNNASNKNFPIFLNFFNCYGLRTISYYVVAPSVPRYIPYFCKRHSHLNVIIDLELSAIVLCGL
jgi:hypothetical protein